MWWCSNDELPLTTEAPTFDQLVARVIEIAPEIAAENGLADLVNDIPSAAEIIDRIVAQAAETLRQGARLVRQ